MKRWKCHSPFACRKHFHILPWTSFSCFLFHMNWVIKSLLFTSPKLIWCLVKCVPYIKHRYDNVTCALPVMHWSKNYVPGKRKRVWLQNECIWWLVIVIVVDPELSNRLCQVRSLIFVYLNIPIHFEIWDAALNLIHSRRYSVLEEFLLNLGLNRNFSVSNKS